ncbi:MAG: hypothetical protein HY014_05210 [Acidobacteria bacterium]|nr:hypothetical protein [Acidobacteriota bacterium]MBI3487550.1 hypothetical protein [Acidobacteriota bacterium]
MGTDALPDLDSTLIRALEGGRPESFKLAWGEVPGSHIPLQYFAVISAQNGNTDQLFARGLYWSGNPFNQRRAVFWCKGKQIDLIEETFWGGLVIPDGQPLQKLRKEKWKEILDPRKRDEYIFTALNGINKPSNEIQILRKHAIKALMGSGNDARVIWKLYLHKCQAEPSILSIFGYDWIALSMLELQGFPGPRASDDYLYWLMIAAENGEPESQWQLAHEFNINDVDSNARRSFWLNRASAGGYPKPIK